jgi:2-polyprenyl-6-hydroxyphenyl methylase/3-demethylubiquinone-9 3-methyltransferase
MDAEVAKFNQMADIWWDLRGANRVLHAINAPRLAFIKQYTTLAGKRVLDVGCGGGILSEAMAKAGAIVIGIDPAAELIRVARAHALQAQLAVTYQQQFIHEVSLAEQERFDIIVCMELLEHVDDVPALLQDCARLLRPQGQLFVATINQTYKAYCLAILGAEYLLRLLPRGTHSYHKFITPYALQQMLQRAGFTLQALCGMQYQPLVNVARLSASLSVNYLGYARREELHAGII